MSSYINPKAIKSVCKNMKMRDFDLFDGGSYYGCYLLDTGSIKLMTKNSKGEKISIVFDGSTHIRVTNTATDKFAMYVEGRYDYTLLEMLRDKFDVEHADDTYLSIDKNNQWDIGSIKNKR